MDFEKCGWLRTDKKLVVEEKVRKFTIENPQQKTINQVTVDGCLITEGIRCDYLFEVNNQENTAIDSVLYVELKGKNVEHASQQLLKTVCDCKSKHSTTEKRCHVVASRVPPQSNAGVQNLRVKLKKCGADLKIHTTQASVTV